MMGVTTYVNWHKTDPNWISYYNRDSSLKVT